MSLSQDALENLSAVLSGLRAGEYDVVNEPEAGQEIEYHIQHLKRICDDVKSGHYVAGGATSSSLATPIITISEEEKEKLKVIPWECVVCMDRFPFFACLPCGHLCLCEECRRQMTEQKCPICAQALKEVVRLYSCHPYPWTPLVKLGYTERASRRAYGRSNGNLREALKRLKVIGRPRHGPGSIDILDLINTSPSSQARTPTNRTRDETAGQRPILSDDVISIPDSAPASPMEICDSPKNDTNGVSRSTKGESPVRLKRPRPGQESREAK